MMLPNLDRETLEKRLRETAEVISKAESVDIKYPTISSANNLQSCIEIEQDIRRQLAWLDELEVWHNKQHENDEEMSIAQKIEIAADAKTFGGKRW